MTAPEGNTKMTADSTLTLDAAADHAPTLLEALQAENALPLWDRFKTLLTREPQAYEPMAWPWARMGPLVDRAAREVSMDDAERRVLLLTHPGFPGTIYTTPSLSCGLQILEPGEAAHAHRHSVGAIRLVMMGQGAETITDGKVCPMEPGDLILTPAWTWHEHRHNGAERVVWFDGLDLPLARQLGTIFLEPGPGPIAARGLAGSVDAALGEGGLLPQGDEAGRPYSPLFRYPWSRTRSVLDAMAPAADGSRRLRYVNPADGGPVMPTIDCFALGLEAASPTRRTRSTETAIVVVIEGEGESQIGEGRIGWKQHDVFTLPRWQWTRHLAKGPATLFLMTDRAMIEGLGYLREEAEEA